jgi:putative ABC transport system ATP-binding protein
LERPTGGTIWLRDEQIDGLSEARLARLRRRAVGFVFQAFHLVDELNALENVELSVLLAGQSTSSSSRPTSAKKKKLPRVAWTWW